VKQPRDAIEAEEGAEVTERIENKETSEPQAT